MREHDIITTVAGNGTGADRATTGRRPRRARRARRASRWCRKPGGKVTIFIADYYNGHVRAVGPDGIIRDLERRGPRGVRRADARGVRRRGHAAAGCTSPTRARTRSSRSSSRRSRRTWRRRRAQPLPLPRRTVGRMSATSDSSSLVRWTLSFLRPYRGRTALVAVLLLVEVGARRAASRGRSRSSSTTCSAASRCRSRSPSWLATLHRRRAARAARDRRRRRRGAADRATSSLSAVRHAGAGRHRASGWSTTCATACSSTCRRSGCTTTSRPAPATRSTASTSTPTRSRTW